MTTLRDGDLNDRDDRNDRKGDEHSDDDKNMPTHEVIEHLCVLSWGWARGRRRGTFQLPELPGSGNRRWFAA